MKYQVYILFSNKLNRFYIGSTSNLDNRIIFHQNAESRKYTYKANDWFLFTAIPCQCKEQTLAIEQHIKKMKSKVYIENLVKYPELQEKLLLQYKQDC